METAHTHFQVKSRGKEKGDLPEADRKSFQTWSAGLQTLHGTNGTTQSVHRLTESIE